MKKISDNLFYELPNLHFARSRMIADCVLESIEFTVSAETSASCLQQFKNIIRALEQNDKKNMEVKENGKTN